jgi:murein L,D-transpeptidase YcbB/YkuD
MLLRDVQSEGLDPADYRADTLDTLAATFDTASPPIPRNVARFDVALSRAMLRYLRHLHLGRLDPRTIGFRLNLSAEGHDFGALLRSALDDDRIAETVAALRPPLVQYRALRTVLTRYRSLAADVSLGSPPAPASAVRPGEPYAERGVLYRQLVAFGDLPAGRQTAAVPETYQGDLVDGVRRFQIRHGLEPDGILGKGTQAALRVPLAWRVRQIELALERLRWLPDLGAQRLVAINIPMFRLWAWDSVPNDARGDLQALLECAPIDPSQ